MHNEHENSFVLLCLCLYILYILYLFIDYNKYLKNILYNDIINNWCCWIKHWNLLNECYSIRELSVKCKIQKQYHCMSYKDYQIFSELNDIINDWYY